MIDGNWQILTVDYAGESMPGRHGLLQIIGARFALQMGGTPREVGIVEFDLKAAPATLDLIWRDAYGRESRRVRAIVRVRGQLMQFCYFPDEGGTRPRAFESAAGPATVPAILVRCRRRPE